MDGRPCLGEGSWAKADLSELRLLSPTWAPSHGAKARTMADCPTAPRLRRRGLRWHGPGDPSSARRKRPDPGAIPTFIPTTARMPEHRSGRPRNIVPGQDTSTDVGERSFGNYDIFEGTEQIQQLVISRAISGLHIR